MVLIVLIIKAIKSQFFQIMKKTVEIGGTPEVLWVKEHAEGPI